MQDCAEQRTWITERPGCMRQEQAVVFIHGLGETPDAWAHQLAALRSAADLDFTARLETIAAPTVVLCGSKDRANLPADRAPASSSEP